MGEAKLKQYSRRKFLETRPYCIYCGALATTTDHCPPRCCFQDRQWPEGYEFPACAVCNAAGRLDELLIGVLARMHLQQDLLPAAQAQWERLVRGLGNNRPELVKELSSTSATQTKRAMRRMFGPEGDRLRHEGWRVSTLGPLTLEAIDRFMVKLAQALYYHHLGRIFEGTIKTHHNSLFHQPADFFESILTYMPDSANPRRGNKSLSDQFSYRYSYSDELGALLAMVNFNPQLIFTFIAASVGAVGAMVAAGDEGFRNSPRVTIVRLKQR